MKTLNVASQGKLEEAKLILESTDYDTGRVSTIDNGADLYTFFNGNKKVLKILVRGRYRKFMQVYYLNNRKVSP